MTTVAPPKLNANWTANDLQSDRSWVFHLDETQRQALEREVRRLFEPGKPLLDYSAEDVDFGPAAAPIDRTFAEALDGRGVALLKGLPREGLTEDEFAFLTWIIGLRQGVARPQNKDSQYLAAVRDIGTDYRSPTGRGYSSNAELDFHVDGADLVALTCYNVARSGGLSMCVSNEAVYAALKRAHPDVLPLLFEDYHFNLQNEQAPGAPATFRAPIFMEGDGRIFIRWVRNRIESAQTRPETPKLDEAHWRALAILDEVIRWPEHVATMMLEPGDMQVLNNHRCLHSRTEFEDFPEAERKRLMFRLWLSPPNAETLPSSLARSYGGGDGNTVRGGMPGQKYDDRCRAFDARQAAFHGMQVRQRG